MLRTVVLAAALAAPLAAQPGRLTEAERGALADLEARFATEFPLRNGWYRDHAVRYYDFGPVEGGDATVTIPVGTNGTTLLEGGRPIFSTLPGLPGYSGVWRVQLLELAPGVDAATIRDARAATVAVLRGDARFRFPRVYVNLPIVPAGSLLADDPAGRALESGWYGRVEVRYFDFGVTDPLAAPIYAFVRAGSSGEREFVRDQDNVVDVAPGDSAYRDLWDVHLVWVREGFVPQAWRSVKALLPGAQVGGYRIQRAGESRNCPIVLLDGSAAPRLPGPWARR